MYLSISRWIWQAVESTHPIYGIMEPLYEGEALLDTEKNQWQFNTMHTRKK
jgi:hypothetical protein